ncbi:MAG: EamA family transporter [Legionellales bacterium]|nr:EamA family transporter [Legionellales bacterium]
MIVENKNTLDRLINYLLLITISIIWGSQFIFNKMALQDFSASEIAFLRSFIGMITLSVLLKFIPVKMNDVYQKCSIPIKNFYYWFF